MTYNGKKVPDVVIKRLPRYYRYLGELLKQGITRISSGLLSEKMEVTASQIRQDFNIFGGFGQQGYGYNIEFLYNEIGTILGLNEGYTAIIIGAGNLGKALAKHSNFKKRGFTINGIFDNNPEKVGNVINGIAVRHTDEMAEFIRNNNTDIAILALPKACAEETANFLINCGIKGLWNFSYSEIKPKKTVAIENVHLSDSLMQLSFKLKNNDADD